MTTKRQLLRTIRAKCLDCSVYQPREVQLCPVYKCDLYAFRMGRDPNPSPSRGFAKSRVYAGENQQGEDK